MPGDRLHARLLYLLTPLSAARGALFIATLGLLGELLNVNALKVLLPGYPAMSVSTVFSLYLLATGLIFAAMPQISAAHRRRGMLVSALLVEFMAIFNFAIYLAGFSTAPTSGMHLLFGGALLISSPYTLACVVLLAASLCLQADGRHAQRVWCGQLMALMALAITFLCAIGYLFSVSILYRVNQEIGMAIHSLAGLALLAVGMANLHVDRGIPSLYYGAGMGSRMLRAWLPKLGLLILAILFAGAKLHVAALDGTTIFAALFILIFICTAFVLWSAAHRLNAEEAALLVEQEKFQALFDGNPDGVIVVDDGGRIVQVNQQAAVLSGYTASQLEGQSAELLVPPALRQAHRKKREAFERHPSPRTMGSDLKIHLACADGSECPVDISIRPAVISGRNMNILSIRDLTERRRIEERMRKLDHDAYHDALTQLPNRRLTQDLLHLVLNRAQRSKRQVAVCYCDLDGFKQVNDSFGHLVGDALLVEASRRMLDCVRGEDFVARLGGDEFLVVLSEVTNRAGALLVVNKLIASVARPYELAGQYCAVTVSVGVAIYPEHPLSPNDLIERADGAMYQAKRTGKNCCVFAAGEPLEAADGFQI